ncbi:PREDICTED: tumor suppressor p53-binding protein 1-like isoform X2 [Vollenhovia emeryi]|nr:PREDICTED: tumor suppressor p53-binding protein 1-like isoform X2 [Vollenhovia emeryi]XP_011866763.1 PREDICTED: tumor suppressor p53-binding protein 1-like isoform X2 [Vollenhovia emeryi]
MSSPKEVIGSPCDTQETCYEDGSLKVNNETQRASLNESQDFHLLVESDDESMVKETQDGEAQQLKTLEALQSEDDNATTRNDREDETVTNEKAMEDQAAEKTEGNVSGESQKKDEPFDEDEVIQGTPPQSYSPSRKMRSVDVASLKRKARTVDEDQIAAKVARTTSTDDATKVEGQLEEEESRQSCESDDSYQDLFKNIDKNVIIEETQDPTNVEFTQNSLQIPTEQVAKSADDKAQKRHTDQQGEEFPEKYSQSEEKDENLNVSAKLADSSANDSMFVMNDSTNESDSQLEDNSPSVETKGDVSSTSVVIADEKTSGIGTLSETESARDTETVADENNRVEQSNCTKKKADDNDGTISSSQTKSRFSVELIYEGANRAVDNESRPKPHVVQIDDDGEKSILDSSAEVTYDSQGTRPEVVQIDDSHEYVERIVLDSLGKDAEIHTVDKSSSYESKSSHMSLESMKETSLDSKLTPETKLVNGSAESKKSDTETTMSLDSDTFIGCDDLIPPAVLTTREILKLPPNRDLSMPKDDNVELISISDHETSNVEEKSKSSLMYNNTKTMQVEREIHVWLKLKCLMHVDENTKEPVSKELTAVQCEPMVIDSVSRQKNDDSQSSLADISDNKDSSPASINSNAQLYQLNPRLSILSSSSSGSSAASLAFKRTQKHLFSMPMGPAKHAKKSSQEALSTAPDKQTLDDTYHRLTHEWKNHRLLTTTILNHANAELGTTATAAAATTIVDTFANVSNEPLDDHHHLEENNMRSSTPSDQPMTSMKIELAVTPKNTKKNKAVKRPRSKMTKSDAAQINGENEPTRRTAASETDTPSSRKKIKTEDTEDKLRMSDMDVLANSSPRNDLDDELIGKNVFAKWSDNNYYPGTVIDRLKTKYKVKFYDGQSKTLIPEFVIPTKILRKGLSVYVTTNINDYGFYGVIIDFDTSSTDNTYYTVETDEHKRLRVQLQNISLTVDQAKVLKEEMDSASKIALLSTPKTLGQVTLDNMVDGKRRSKRIGTPLFSTPKSRSNAAGTSTPASKTKAEPSVSGMSAKLKREKGVLSENEGVSSDSNVELVQTGDEWYVLRGVQKEINGTPYEQIVKGPQSRIKGKSRSKKKAEDDLQMIQDLGPIPSNSIFKGMSFILTCAVLKKLDRYPKDTKVSTASETETDASETDFETENEDGWVDQAFVRERLHAQILAGGGKLYEDFGEIPKDEYKNTILISNVPNTTAKTILCLSVGIRVCNHKWVSRSCNEGKAVSTAEYALPNGWSLKKKIYIEAYETSKSKPLSEIVVIIPSLAYDGEYAIFWQQVCENAGAIVVIVEDSGAMEKIDFVYSNVVIISNRKCPLWATDRAAREQIPVLSTTWVVQCIIEGQLCPRDEHPCYRYNYILN